MREQEFVNWMLESGYNHNKIIIFLDSCRRIEEFEGSIDAAYAAGHGRALLKKFRYTAKDRDEGRQPAHAVPIKSDALKETDSLKKALKFYLDFLVCTEQKAVLRMGEIKKAGRKIYAKKQNQTANSAISALTDNERYYSQFKPRRNEELVGRKLLVGKQK
jgi:predicted ATP-binding protein involved in virulence